MLKDLHSHVLPFVDDGAKNMEMSLEMLRNAKAQGVDTVVATPHCITDVNEAIAKFVAKRNDSYEKLLSEIEGKAEYPKVLLGCEVYLGCDMSDFEDLSKLCYEGSDYILLEMPSGFEPSEIAEWIYNISIKGLRPVIAHIDRCPDYDEIMQELSGMDVVYQVNASQFLTMKGRHLLKKIFKHHNKFFVSSDMHNTSSRCCNLNEAKAICDKKFAKMSSLLFEDGASYILSNKAFFEN